jgi:phosphatidylcholine synthase
MMSSVPPAEPARAADVHLGNDSRLGELRRDEPARPGQGNQTRSFPWAAWLTHVYTATGAGLAFLSLAAVVAGNIRAAFVYLVVALVVDSSDGVLARGVHIRERLPEVDGAHLDDIIDYLTYVFVPAFLLYHTGRLPVSWGLAVVFAVLISSVIAFSKSDAKTADHFFTGFPSYWNVLAFYLYAFSAPPVVNGAILLVFCLLIFIRIGYVYPSRTTTLRPVTVLFASAWGVLMLFLLWQMPAMDRTLLWLSLAFPVYYTVLSLVLHLRRKP